MVPRSTANGRELVEWKDLDGRDADGIEEQHGKRIRENSSKGRHDTEQYGSTAYRRELVEWKDLTLTRSART